MSPLIPHSLTERDLIKNSLKGDRKSQKLLFETYAGRMLAVCQRYARVEGEAEDFLQEGFIKVFSNLNKFNHEGSFEGWIRKIMVNTALRGISKKSFKNEIPGIDDHVENDLHVDPVVLSKLQADELLSLVDNLPEGYRVVFNLFAIEGYSHKEISALLKIEESTSRTQLLKARRYLKKQIEDLQKIAV